MNLSGGLTYDQVFYGGYVCVRFTIPLLEEKTACVSQRHFNHVLHKCVKVVEPA